MLRVLLLVRTSCRLPLSNGILNRLMRFAPKPANPFGLKPMASAIYARNGGRQTQLTYLSYFQSFSLEKRPFLSKEMASARQSPSPKPANPLDLKQMVSIIYGRNDHRQTQLTYLPYFQSFGLEKGLLFRRNDWFDTLLPSGAIVSGIGAGSAEEGRWKVSYGQRARAESSPRTELRCSLESAAC